MTSDTPNKRFADAVTQEVINSYSNSWTSESAKKKQAWAVGTYSSWVIYRNNFSRHKAKEPPILKELKDQDDNELDYSLSRFAAEARKQDGKMYPGKTLYELIISIQSYLRHECKKSVTLIDVSGKTFPHLNAALNNEMKEATSAGVGVETKQADVVSMNQEELLWEKGILGSDSPETLRDTLLWIFGLHFGLRAGQEHRSLRMKNSQISAKVDETGKSYLQYVQDVSKTNSGGLAHRNVKRKVCRAYENLEQPERCPVRLYSLYLSHCPSDLSKTQNAFYLRPLEKPNSHVWYYNQAAGKNTLSAVVGKLMKKGGFQGYYTNHSLRATCATRLYQENVDEQIIQEITGHRSLDGLRSYKRTSTIQKQTTDSLLQPPASNASVKSLADSKTPDKTNKLEIAKPETTKCSDDISAQPLTINPTFESESELGQIQEPPKKKFKFRKIQKCNAENVDYSDNDNKHEKEHDCVFTYEYGKHKFKVQF